ncbi:phosphotyrosine-protein phosphatase [Escherichia coli]|uniref:Phosphotyrosine-protein phosphatase n=1 Tax=Escherichia coli TaxID=562 RepID=A0A376ZVL5_ECOLX|nr:phosphotyrosine-protein phosphatase [Escherichia coli]
MAQLKFNSILVVCTGNICRSPIGERLLRKRLPGVKVKSAGVHGLVNTLQMRQRQMLPLIMAYLLKDMPDVSSLLRWHEITI